MKLFKLVITGTAILMCALLMVTKKSTGFHQSAPNNFVMQQDILQQDTGLDITSAYPLSIVIDLPQ